MQPMQPDQHNADHQHPGQQSPAPGDWQVTEVPRPYHDAFPKDQRPRLRPAWDVFTWTYILLTLGGLALAAFVMIGYLVFPGPAVIALSLGIGAVYLALVWFGMSRLLIYRGTPMLLAFAAIVWGGTGALLIGVSPTAGHLMELAHDFGVPEISMSLGGAYTEELAKGLGVWLLLQIGRTWWNRPWHGLVAGMLVGLGFEVFENVMYAAMLAVIHPASDVSGVLDIWIMRTVFGPFMHVIFSGLVGYGIGVAVFGRGLSRTRRLGWILCCGFAGFFFHACWNLIMDSVAAQLTVYAVSWSAAAALLVTAIVRSTREARPAARVGAYPVVSIYRKVPEPLPIGHLPGLPGEPAQQGWQGQPAQQSWQAAPPQPQAGHLPESFGRPHRDAHPPERPTTWPSERPTTWRSENPNDPEEFGPR